VGVVRVDEAIRICTSELEMVGGIGSKGSRVQLQRHCHGGGRTVVVATAAAAAAAARLFFVGQVVQVVH
jgi:hypothetical protein